MSQGEKRLEAMRRNPAGDWKIADVELICRTFDMSCSPPPGGGSHYRLSHPARPELLTIPARRPIKSVYIRKLVAFVDEVRQHR
jgi:hypothetical protein